MAKTFRLRGKLRLNRPFNQNFLVGCTLFCLPGIYLALTGLGAGGGRPSSQAVSSEANAILYGLFTLFGWMGGSILNTIKPKMTIVIGAIGYPLYTGGFWYYDRTGNEWFPLWAGAMLGISAGFLWTGAGFIQFAYADEDSKAMYITVQWVLTSLGGTVGAFISFGANFHQTEATGVSNAVYAVFVVIMCSAIVVAALGLKHPEDIVRDDGTHLAVFHRTDLWTEIKGVAACFTEMRILIILPGIFCAEIVLVLMSSLNGYFFNLRTRSLNNIMFEMIMIPAPLALAWAMDNKFMKRRRSRGMLGIAIMTVISVATYAGVLGWIVHYNIDRNATAPAVDWSMSSFASGFVLYILSGTIYSGFQICGQWTLAALSNDPYKCARYAGLFKGTTSLGLMAAFLMDSKGVSYLTQTIVHLVLYAIGATSLLSVTWFYVRDTNYFLEADVIAPEHVTKEAFVSGVITEEDVSKEKEKERERKQDKELELVSDQRRHPVVNEITAEDKA